MEFSRLTLSVRVAVPLATSVVAYLFYRWIEGRDRGKDRTDALLLAAYIVSRASVWLLFALYLQSHVTTSDPRLFYQPQLDHFLAGDIPIRDFYYPYAPLMMP